MKTTNDDPSIKPTWLVIEERNHPINLIFPPKYQINFEVIMLPYPWIIHYKRGNPLPLDPFSFLWIIWRNVSLLFFFFTFGESWDGNDVVMDIENRQRVFEIRDRVVKDPKVERPAFVLLGHILSCFCT